MTSFNYYKEVVSASGSFPAVGSPQVIINFRGVNSLILVCTSGSVEYSFDGINVHGAMSSTGNDKLLDFGPRVGKTIYVRGTGTVRVHAYQ